MVDKYVPALLEKAKDGADVIASNSVETIECEHCGNRYFASEECPCLADEWYADDFEGEASGDWTLPAVTTPHRAHQ